MILLAAAALAPAQTPAMPRTMRLDYVHTGTATEERFGRDAVVLESAWPGPLDRWIDDTNLGTYQFQVVDRTTQPSPTPAATPAFSASGGARTKPRTSSRPARSTKACAFRRRPIPLT